MQTIHKSNFSAILYWTYYTLISVLQVKTDASTALLVEVNKVDEFHVLSRIPRTNAVVHNPLHWGFSSRVPQVRGFFLCLREIRRGTFGYQWPMAVS